MRRLLSAIAALATLSCGDPDDEAVSRHRAAIIHGADDRHDAHAEPSIGLRALARAAVALVKPEQLRFTSELGVEVRAAPLRAWDRYCDGTPFLDQPTAATCSAVLIDDDLALTAGHCLEEVAECSDYFYLFDYLYAASDELGPLDRNAVFGCRRVAARLTSAPDQSEQVDVAIVQLDRPAGASRAPAPPGEGGPVTPGEPLVAIGFPSGLPAKIDAGAVATDPRETTLDYFTLTSDTFRASSGSGIYRTSGELVGVFARGGSDFVDQGSCRALRRIPEESAPSESATYAARAIEALCRDGWPSERLCGITPSCGDGVCSAAAAPAETPESCSADCVPAACGDGLCEKLEWSACPEDCGDRRPAELPDGWYCEPAWHADGHTCDCECGAIDPDCGAGRGCESVGPAGLDPPTPSTGSADAGCSVVAPASAGASNRLPFPSAWLLFPAIALGSIGRRRRAREPVNEISGDPCVVRRVGFRNEAVFSRPRRPSPAFTPIPVATAVPVREVRPTKTPGLTSPQGPMCSNVPSSQPLVN
jgi:hypothetical protein